MALSHKDIRAILTGALTKPAKGYLSVVDIWPDTFVYSVYNPDKGTESTYSRTYQIDLDGKPTLGTESVVRPVTTYEPVTFSGVEVGPATFADDRAHEARLFKIGEYPDKSFSLTAEEADAAVAAFAPTPILLEHGRTAVGRTEFGTLDSLRRDGDWLYGVTRMVDAAAKALKGSTPKLSMSWDRATKLPVEVSLVQVPRVAEAGLVAAFSGDGETGGDSEKPARIGAAMVTDFIKNLFGGKEPTDAERAEFTQKLGGLDDIPGLKAANAAKDAEIATLKAEIGTVKAGPSVASFAGRNAAERIVADLRKDGRLTPAEEPEAVAAFSQAIAAGPAEFSNSGDLVETDLVKALKASYEKRPKLGLTERTSAEFSVGDGKEGGEAKKPGPLDATKITADFNARRKA